MEAMQEHVAAFPFHFISGQKRVTAQIICYHGPTIQQAIKAIYNDVDEIVIAHGPVALWKDVPPDNSLQLIKDCPDPDKKIKVGARALWKDKSEMRTWCHENSTGNRMLIVDADEIIVGLDAWLKLDPKQGSPRWFNFWHDKEHYVEDMPGMRRWGKSLDGLPGGTHTQFRWSWWRNGSSFPGDKGTRSHCSCDTNLNNYGASVAAVKACPSTIIYHLGHVLTPEMMKAKHDFYLARDGVDAGRVARKTIWHNWAGQLGDCGDGFVQKVSYELPEIVMEAFEAIEKGNNHATE